MTLPTGPVTDAEMAEADLRAYAKALPSPTGLSACVAIEQAWDLFGYPPQVVTEVLSAVAAGAGFDDALDAALAR